jgi:phosphotransferase system  glucose/maltose/N-acetylglucosamine-specific IIC component
MVGRGIAVAGIWLGIGMAIGMTGSAHPNLPGWVYKWIIGGALIATMPIVLPLLAPQSWDKNG